MIWNKFQKNSATSGGVSIRDLLFFYEPTVFVFLLGNKTFIKLLCDIFSADLNMVFDQPVWADMKQEDEDKLCKVMAFRLKISDGYSALDLSGHGFDWSII